MSNKWVLSATEIQTFDLCRRKWAYIYLDAIKPPISKAAEFGSLVHKYLENYLINGLQNSSSEEGRCAQPGLQYLPIRLPKENVEKNFLFCHENILFNGYIDFFEHLGSQIWLIGDHKTTSNLKNAALASDLTKNIQANIYAQWAFKQKDAEKVKLRWIYYRTNSKPQALCVESELSKSEAETNFEKIIDISKTILSVVDSKAKSHEQPKNLSSCFKYGKCPFYQKCHQENNAKFPQAISFETTDEEKLALPHFTRVNSASFHLFIDCWPIKNQSHYEKTIELSELLQPVLENIRKEKDIAHYRFAGFGQHVGLVANYLTTHLKKNAYNNRTAILTSMKTPEGCDTLQTLIASASQVVRGF